MTPANEAAFLVASVDLAPILIPAGVIVAVLVIALLLDHHGAELGRVILPEADELRHQWPDLDADLEREAEMRYRAQAPRRRGQDLPPIAGIGDRSLDEIRREYGGGAA